MVKRALAGPWRWIFPLVAFAGGLPLFFARHPPFSDLPEHVAVIATLRHWFDPAFRSQELFTVEGAFRTQYWLYDVVGAALAFPLGSAERANMALLFMAAVGLPHALRLLLRAAHHDERLALLGVPLVWSRALAEGLVNFVASIPVAVLGLALALAQASRPTRGRGAALAGLAVALFYLHLSSFLLFAAGAVAFAVACEVRRRKRGAAVRAARQLVWMVPASVAAAVFALTSPVTHPDPSQGAHATVVRWMPKGVLLRELPAWMHDVWTSPWDDVAAVVCWAGVVVTVVAGRASDVESSRRVFERNLARGLVVLALGFYFLVPSQVGFAFILDLRMAPFVGLFAVLLARPLPARRWVGTAAASLVAIGALVSTVHCAVQMRAFEREEASLLDVMLRRLPHGKRLLSLTFDAHSPRTTIPPFLHAGAYYRARYGGIASFSFSELPHWPVRYRPEAAPPKKRMVFWDFAPCLYRNTVDGVAYDYVLTRGDARPFDEAQPGPAWRLVGAAREWRLYERVPGAGVAVPDGYVDGGPCRAEEAVSVSSEAPVSSERGVVASRRE